MKEEVDPNASKRRKLKRDHQSEGSEYSPVSAAPPLNMNMAPAPYDRDRDRERDGRGGDRKATAALPRQVYMEEPSQSQSQSQSRINTMHGKDVPPKTTSSRPYPSFYLFIYLFLSSKTSLLHCI